MFKKSKRSFRQRLRCSDSDDDGVSNESRNVLVDSKADLLENDKTIGENCVPTTTELFCNDGSQSSDSNHFNKLQSDTKTKSKLSFHDEDEEEDVFVIKKSVYSRRMERNKKKLLKSTTLEQNNSKEDSNQNNEKENATIQEPNNEINLDSKQEIICPGSESEEETEIVEPLKKSKQTNSIHQFRNAVERGCIPDAKVIYELKKQRQKLARTANEDFIPIENIDEEDRSRLVRNDDDDDDDDKSDDDDDDNESDRIQFGKVDYKTLEREKTKEQFRLAQEEQEAELPNSDLQKKLSDDDDDDDDEDDDEDLEQKSNMVKSDDSEDELDRWEREQIRKAVRIPNILSYETEFNNRFINEKISSKAQFSEDNHNVVPIEVDNQETKTFGTFIPNFITERTKENQKENDYETIIENLSAMKCKITESIEEHTMQSNRVTMDSKLTLQNISLYDTLKQQYTDDYNFYRNTLDFVRNLCDCINDKQSDIDKYELEMLDLFENYSKQRLLRKRKDIQEQNQLCIQLVTNHNTNYITYKNSTINSIFEVFNLTDDSEKLKRAIKREDFYRKHWNCKSIIIEDDHVDDDNEEQKLLTTKLKLMEEKLTELFDDTDDDYASVGGVLKQFEIWKQSRPNTYIDSFISDFIGKFLIYYIRYELILWNIFLTQTKSEFFELKCVQDLILYCTSNIEEKYKYNLNDVIDIDLIPNIVDNTFIQRLSILIERQLWNPISTTQTKCLVSFVKLILEKFPTLIDNSKHLPILLQKIMKQIEITIENDIFIPQYIPGEYFNSNQCKQFNYETLTLMHTTTFFQYQFDSTIQLMSNLISLRTIIDEKFIKEFTLNKICNRYILMSIQRTSNNLHLTVNNIQKLISIVPKDWCKLNEPVILKLSDLVQQLIELPNINSFSDVTAKLITIKLQLTT